MVSIEATVGVINSDPDITSLLAFAVELEGFHTATENFNKIKDQAELYTRFINLYDPKVIVIDVPPPFKENFDFVQNLEARPESHGRGFVRTTQGKAILEQQIGKTACIGVLGFPCELYEFIDEVKRTYTLTLNKPQNNN